LVVKALLAELLQEALLKASRVTALPMR